MLGAGRISKILTDQKNRDLVTHLPFTVATVSVQFRGEVAMWLYPLKFMGVAYFVALVDKLANRGNWGPIL